MANKAEQPMDTVPLGVKGMNIFEKLSSIAMEITNVNKNLNVGTGATSYKAVGEADVLAAVRPAESKFRVYSYPVSRKIIDSGTIETKNYKGETKNNLYERIEVTYRFVNIDKPDEYIEIVSYGDGIDPGDKSVGKAMTYADKYALLKAYKIITGDDPDQEVSEEVTVKTPRNGGRPSETTQAKAPVEKKPFKAVTDETRDQLNLLGVTLDQAAEYLKTTPDKLNDDIVKALIIRIQKKHEMNKAKAQQQTEPPVDHTDDADWVG